MLVASFAGREIASRAYRHAIAAGYRFYSLWRRNADRVTYGRAVSYEEFDLSTFAPTHLQPRRSKAKIEDFAGPLHPAPRS